MKTVEERVDEWLEEFNHGGWVEERVETVRPSLISLLRDALAPGTSADPEPICGAW